MPDRVEHDILNPNDSTVSKGLNNVKFVFYPAYCYTASPTWFTWVKLTAFDIHHQLTVQPGYHAAPSYTNNESTRPQNQPLLLFYLNHPIQFVQLVGVVVTFESFFDKFWLFVLDDSSGATIEVNCRKPEKPDSGDGDPTVHNGREQKVDKDAEARYEAMAKLDIGAVVQVKGQITTFRNVRQLQLERILLVKDTNHEIRLIAARTDFHEKILARAWEVSSSQQRLLRDRALGESNAENEHALRKRKRAQWRAAREKRHAEEIQQLYEQEEMRRQGLPEQAHSSEKAPER